MTSPGSNRQCGESLRFMLCVPDASGTAAVTVNFYSTSLHSRYLSLYTLHSLKVLPMHCKSYPIYFIKHTIWACPLVKCMSWFANLDWEKSAAINKHLKHAYPLRPLWKDLSRVWTGGSLLRVHNPRHFLLPPSLPSSKKWGCHLNCTVGQSAMLLGSGIFVLKKPY